MMPPIRRVLFSLLIVGLGCSGAAQARTPDEIQQVLREAKAKAVVVVEIKVVPTVPVVIVCVQNVAKKFLTREGLNAPH